MGQLQKEYIVNKQQLILMDMRERGYYEKYNAPGVYCIKIEDKIVYVGKAVDMVTRIIAHIIEIDKVHSTANKYKVLHEAKAQGLQINFDVLYTSPRKTRKAQEKDIGRREGELIREYSPALNYQIPDAQDFHKYTINKKAKTITLAEVLA